MSLLLRQQIIAIAVPARYRAYDPQFILFTKRTARGFSVFEVLVVIAVIALITGIITVNFNRIIPALEHKPLERQLVENLQDARLLAATSGNVVTLRFDSQSQRFIITERARKQALDNKDSKDVPSKSSNHKRQGSAKQQTSVLFFPKLSPSTRNSARALEFSRDSVPELVFHPSGVSTPARVVIQRPGAEDQEIILDAFSSGPPDSPHS